MKDKQNARFEKAERKKTNKAGRKVGGGMNRVHESRLQITSYLNPSRFNFGMGNGIKKLKKRDVSF